MYYSKKHAIAVSNVEYGRGFTCPSCHHHNPQNTTICEECAEKPSLKVYDSIAKKYKKSRPYTKHSTAEHHLAEGDGMAMFYTFGWTLILGLTLLIMVLSSLSKYEATPYLNPVLIFTAIPNLITLVLITITLFKLPIIIRLITLKINPISFITRRLQFIPLISITAKWLLLYWSLKSFKYTCMFIMFVFFDVNDPTQYFKS